MPQTASRDDPAANTAGTSTSTTWIAQWSSRHFERVHSVEGWSPAVNVYRLDRHLAVCVDLAGIDRQSIDVRVEPGRLIVRGVRHAPDPRRQQEAMRIMVMEIDHGPFCRVLDLPPEVDLNRVESHYDNGLLWVTLPLRVTA